MIRTYYFFGLGPGWAPSIKFSGHLIFNLKDQAIINLFTFSERVRGLFNLPFTTSRFFTNLDRVRKNPKELKSEVLISTMLRLHFIFMRILNSPWKNGSGHGSRSWMLLEIYRFLIYKKNFTWTDLCLNLMKRSEIKNFLFISLFSTFKIYVLRSKSFFLHLLIDFLPPWSRKSTRT